MSELRRRLLYAKPKEVPNYLCFTALEEGTFTLTIPAGLTLASLSYIEYSIDEGVTWTHTDNVANSIVTITTPTIAEGSKVLWRGSGARMSQFNAANNTLCSIFSSTCNYNVSGVLMSLLVGKNAKNSTELTSTHIFPRLFIGDTHLCDISGLILAPNVTSSCYQAIFRGCTSLESVPQDIFHATTLAAGCYQEMFYECTSLVNVPKNLLPVTTLANNCYQQMFSGCTNLVNTPNLPATTLANNCYYGMFRNCTSLIDVPQILSATTLYSACYHSMFYACSSLEKAPELPATTLVSQCYLEMFRSCTNLKYVKMMAIDIVLPNNSQTSNWLTTVSSSGTFIRNPQATWWLTGGSGIPSGWTWFDGTESTHTPYHFVDSEVERVCVESWGGIMGGNAVNDTRFDNVKRGGYQDGVITEEQIETVIRLRLEFSENTLIETFNELADFTNLKYIGTAGKSGFYNCSNLREITLPNSLMTINDGYVYSQGAFMGTAIESIYIPDSVIAMGDATFYNCTSLKSVRWSSNCPEPASGTSYYARMFQECTSLETITNFPTNVIRISSNEYNGCQNLIFDFIELDKVVFIGQYGLRNCKTLQENMIFNSLVRLDNYAFTDSSVKRAYFPLLQTASNYGFSYAMFTLIDLGEYFGGLINLGGYTSNTCTVVIRNSDSSAITSIQNNVKKVYVPSTSLADYQTKFTAISTKIFEIGGTEWVSDFGSSSEWADYPNGQAPIVDIAQHEIEYIRPTIGTAFDTGITPTSNTRMVVSGKYYMVSTTEIAGTYFPTTQRFHIGVTNSKFYFGCGNKYLSALEGDTNLHTFELYGNGTGVIDNTNYSIGATLGTATTTITLLARHNNATTNYTQTIVFYLYSAKIYKGTTLLKDYVPYRYMGGIYFKDKVSGNLEFIGNEENFEIGNDVNS